jgi:hypothetical protein
MPSSPAAITSAPMSFDRSRQRGLRTGVARMRKAMWTATAMTAMTPTDLTVRTGSVGRPSNTVPAPARSIAVRAVRRSTIAAWPGRARPVLAVRAAWRGRVTNCSPVRAYPERKIE